MTDSTPSRPVRKTRQNGFEEHGRRCSVTHQLQTRAPSRPDEVHKPPPHGRASRDKFIAVSGHPDAAHSLVLSREVLNSGQTENTTNRCPPVPTLREALAQQYRVELSNGIVERLFRESHLSSGLPGVSQSETEKLSARPTWLGNVNVGRSLVGQLEQIVSAFFPLVASAGSGRKVPSACNGDKQGGEESTRYRTRSYSHRCLECPARRLLSDGRRATRRTRTSAHSVAFA